jgi:hypothetical protein
LDIPAIYRFVGRNVGRVGAASPRRFSLGARLLDHDMARRIGALQQHLLEYPQHRAEKSMRPQDFGQVGVHHQNVARAETIIGPLQRAQQSPDQLIHGDPLATVGRIGEAANHSAIGHIERIAAARGGF